MSVGDGRLTEVEDRGCKHRRGMTLRHPADEIVESADTPRGDHRHARPVRNGADQVEVIAVAGSIPVHRRQQDFACAKLRQAQGMSDGINTRSASAAG